MHKRRVNISKPYQIKPKIINFENFLFFAVKYDHVMLAETPHDAGPKWHDDRN